MKTIKNKYRVTIELDIVEIDVVATSINEARIKAMTKLSKKNIFSLIRRHYATHRKEISIDKL